MPADRDKRLSELKELLLERDYRPKEINAALDKAKNISREKALEKVTKINQMKDQSLSLLMILNFKPYQVLSGGTGDP